MVEIIPKKTGKEISLKNIYFFIVGALLLAIISGYAILVRSEASISSKIEDLEASIIKIGTREDRESERMVFESESKIKNFKDLWLKRRSFLEFFDDFEKIVHPQVWFFSFDLDASEYSLALSGKTANFKSLEQQLIFLKSQKDFIESFDLSEVKLEKDGGVGFSLNINFKK